MNRTISLSGVAIIAAVLAGCGSTSHHAKGGGSRTDTVSLASVSGVGKVLVDSKGFALYSPAQEKSGTIRCTGSCAAIWLPLTVHGSPSAAGSGLKLGTVMRPDGKTQVTFDGKPLYRFAEDSTPKTVGGNGVSDDFGGKKFTWHVASPGKTNASSGGGRYSSGY